MLKRFIVISSLVLLFPAHAQPTKRALSSGGEGSANPSTRQCLQPPAAEPAPVQTPKVSRRKRQAEGQQSTAAERAPVQSSNRSKRRLKVRAVVDLSDDIQSLIFKTVATRTLSGDLPARLEALKTVGALQATSKFFKGCCADFFEKNFPSYKADPWDFRDDPEKIVRNGMALWLVKRGFTVQLFERDPEGSEQCSVVIDSSRCHMLADLSVELSKALTQYFIPSHITCRSFSFFRTTGQDVLQMKEALEQHRKNGGRVEGLHCYGERCKEGNTVARENDYVKNMTMSLLPTLKSVSFDDYPLSVMESWEIADMLGASHKLERLYLRGRRREGFLLRFIRHPVLKEIILSSKHDFNDLNSVLPTIPKLENLTLLRPSDAPRWTNLLRLLPALRVLKLVRPDSVGDWSHLFENSLSLKKLVLFSPDQTFLQKVDSCLSSSDSKYSNFQKSGLLHIVMEDILQDSFHRALHKMGEKFQGRVRILLFKPLFKMIDSLRYAESQI